MVVHRTLALSLIGAAGLTVSVRTEATAAPRAPSWGGFETGRLSEWRTTGDAWSIVRGPVSTDRVEAVSATRIGGDYWRGLPGAMGVRGSHWLSSERRRSARELLSRRGLAPGDSSTGTATSAPFRLNRGERFVSFLISGGRDSARLRIELLRSLGRRLVPVRGAPPKTGHGSEVFRRDWWDLGRVDTTKQFVIRLTDQSRDGHLNIDDIRFERTDPSRSTRPDGLPALLRIRVAGRDRWVDYDAPVWGAADMHTHLMSHLSMGRKALHGAPDIGSIVPAGSHACNKSDLRAQSVAQALGSCASSHGGWGADNTCGNHMRAAVLNIALDDAFVHRFDMPGIGGCAKGRVADAGLCYAKCREGYHGRATRCYRDCPPGFPDVGVACALPRNYWRKVHPSLGACQAAHGRSGCEQIDPLKVGLWYEKCRAGFYASSANRCSEICPRGYEQAAETCTKPPGYDRGPGTPSPNLHGDHKHDGYPNFLYWPHHSTKAHQQMYVDWIRRAFDGGLRVLVALAVNNELLGEMLSGDHPKDDKTSADVQVREIVSFVGRHSDWMTVVRSAADLRRTLHEGKLAVIVGVEFDNIGGFNRRSRPPSAAEVRQEIRRLHDSGVRYIFPIHFADNVFGGAAVCTNVTNLGNRYARSLAYWKATFIPHGLVYNVEATRDPRVEFRLASFKGSAALAGIRAAIELMTALPFPPGMLAAVPVVGHVLEVIVNALHHGTRMLSLLPQVQLAKKLLTDPEPWFDRYKAIREGHVNARGLQPLGEVALEEMMRLGMIIDIDHMSEKTASAALKIVRRRRYPVTSGHTGFRANGHNNENGRTEGQLKVIESLGGVMGVGWAGEDATAAKYLYSWRFGHRGYPRMGFAIGSDINGFELMPGPRHYDRPPPNLREMGYSTAQWRRQVQYRRIGAPRSDRRMVKYLWFATEANSDYPGGDLRNLAVPAGLAGRDACETACAADAGCKAYTWNDRTRRCWLKSRVTRRVQAPGFVSAVRTRSWDYNTEGIAHIGLYPDLFQDLANLGMTREERATFFGAADFIARMWDTIEVRKRNFGARVPEPPAIPFALYEGADYPGHDIGRPRRAGNAAACQEACRRHLGCKAFTWHPSGRCFLKARLGKRIPAPRGFVTGVRLQDEFARAPQKQFRIFMNADHPGGDLGPGRRINDRNGRGRCQLECIFNRRCLAFTWHQGTRRCWLKGTVNRRRSVPGFVTGLRPR